MADLTRLTLVEKQRDLSQDQLSWRPFERTSKFNSQWWDRKQYGRTWFVQALLADQEVARIQLNPDVDIIGYIGAPTARVRDLQIAYFEVAAGQRLRGIGTAVIHALAEQYPDRRLVADSKGADGFWAHLEWKRCVHATGPQFRPPMFFS